MSVTPEHVRLTLYARTGCHLCEDMEALLGELFTPGSFTLERRDIDAEPALRARYDRDVPVLVDGEVELCRHFLDPLVVTAHLERCAAATSVTAPGAASVTASVAASGAASGAEKVPEAVPEAVTGAAPRADRDGASGELQ